MFSSIKTTEANKLKITELTRKFNLGAENVIARIAYSYSISQERKLDISNIKDSRGKEYSKNILFGKYVNYYIALVSQHYNIYKADPNIPKYIKMHVDDGIELLYNLYNKHQNFTSTDFLIDILEKNNSYNAIRS